MRFAPGTKTFGDNVLAGKITERGLWRHDHSVRLSDTSTLTLARTTDTKLGRQYTVSIQECPIRQCPVKMAFPTIIIVMLTVALVGFGAKKIPDDPGN